MSKRLNRRSFFGTVVAIFAGIAGLFDVKGEGADLGDFYGSDVIKSIDADQIFKYSLRESAMEEVERSLGISKSEWTGFLEGAYRADVGEA